LLAKRRVYIQFEKEVRPVNGESGAENTLAYGGGAAKG